MKLHAKASNFQIETIRLLRIVRAPDGIPDPEDHALCVCSFDDVTNKAASRFPLVLSIGAGEYSGANDYAAGLENLNYLETGDVISADPMGNVRVLYRKTSDHNFIFSTNNCNSLCLMCSQPPALFPEPNMTSEHLRLIDLIDPGTKQLGITGGEPTYFKEDFLRVVAHCKQRLPRTALHILSNGRSFADASFAAMLAEIGHPSLMLGIPLYADVDHVHDHVVQVRGAFRETIHGIYNLAENGIGIEVRNVLNRLTVRRLEGWAYYLSRNLTFVNHIALMGMEMTGFVHRNMSELWIDPHDYGEVLSDVLSVLGRAGFDVSLYNHQLCVVPMETWPYAVRSISDWKNVYLPACSECLVRDRCGGFFQSGTMKRSRHIAPILEPPTAITLL